MPRKNNEPNQHNTRKSAVSRKVGKGIAVVAIAGLGIATALAGYESSSSVDNEEKLKAIAKKTAEDISHNKPVKVLTEGRAAIEFKNGSVRLIDNPIVDESGAVAERTPGWASENESPQLTFYSEGVQSPINNVTFDSSGNWTSKRVVNEVTDVSLIKDVDSYDPSPDQTNPYDSRLSFLDSSIGTPCTPLEAIKFSTPLGLTVTKPNPADLKGQPNDYFVNEQLNNLHIAEGNETTPSEF